MVLGAVRELLGQIFSVLAYMFFRNIASAPAITYVAVMFTTVFANRRITACTLLACNRLLLHSTLRVSISLLLYSLLGLYNLDPARGDV